MVTNNPQIKTGWYQDRKNPQDMIYFTPDGKVVRPTRTGGQLEEMSDEKIKSRYKSVDGEVFTSCQQRLNEFQSSGDHRSGYRFRRTVNAIICTSIQLSRKYRGIIESDRPIKKPKFAW